MNQRVGSDGVHGETDLRRHGPIYWSPPDIARGRVLFDNTFVERRTARFDPGIGAERTGGGDSRTSLKYQSIFV